MRRTPSPSNLDARVCTRRPPRKNGAPANRLHGTLLVAFLAAAPSLQAASHTWSGATSGLWSVASNWSAGGAPLFGETNVVLIFPNGMGNMGSMSNDVGTLNVTSITFSDTAYAVTGTGINLNGSITVNGGTAFADVQVGINIALTGPGTFVSDGAGDRYLTITGAISGAQNVVVQSAGGPDGLVSFFGANSYTGTTTVSSGFLGTNAVNSLGATATGTTIASGASLRMTGHSLNEPLTVGGTGVGTNGAIRSEFALNTLGGPIALTANTTVAALTFSLQILGVISGAAGLSFRSPAGATLGAANLYAGPTTLEYGTLTIDGNQPTSSVLLLGAPGPATLRGQGIVGPISLLPGSAALRTVAPGSPALTSPIVCGGLNLQDPVGSNHGSLTLRLNGTAGSQFDQVFVTGSVNVAGAALSVSFGYVPSVGHNFQIVDNDGADPVVGTFAGLPEGATFFAGGRTLQISYVGGTGNDIALTVTSLTPVALQSFDAD